MRIALVQTDCRLGDTDANLTRARAAVADAAARGADLAVLPELILSGYSLGALFERATLTIDDPALSALSLDGGGPGGGPSVAVGLAEGGRGLRDYNSAVYIEHGTVVHVHRKLYLPTYGAFEERKHFSPGQAMRAFDTRLGRLALLICNDAWQPMLPFVAVQDGAEILLVLSASAYSSAPDVLDTPRYWREITHFYACMYASYVVFVNRVGQEGELRFWGGSHVVDPSGRLIAEAPEGEEAMVIVDVDLDEVFRRRRAIPLIREARLGLLRRELDRLVEEGGDV